MPETVDEYIAEFEDEARLTLERLRALALDTAKGCEETLRWGNPTYGDETAWFQFAGHKRQATVTFTAGTLEYFRDELGAYKGGKGTVQIPYGSPFPANLLRRMIEYRMEECRLRAAAAGSGNEAAEEPE